MFNKKKCQRSIFFQLRVENAIGIISSANFAALGTRSKTTLVRSRGRATLLAVKLLVVLRGPVSQPAKEKLRPQ